MAASLIRLVFGISVIGFAGSAASGALIERDWLALGDGLLTYDDVNQREWLDLTETQLQGFPGESIEERFFAVVDQTSPGGKFAGFVVGNETELLELALSGGVDPSSMQATVNGAAVSEAIELFGITRFTTASVASEALLLGANGETEGAGFIYVAGRSESIAHLAFDLAQSIDDGVWLYRVVPEPTSAMGASVLFLFGVYRRSKRGTSAN